MRYGISGVNSRCSGLSQAGPFCRRHDPADLKKTDMGKNEVIYNGESVKISGTDNPDEVLVRFTDSITAFNKIKKASIAGKGRLNAAIAAMIFGILEKNGIRTHFLSRVSEDGLLCRRVEIIPIEVIVRNVIAGSMAARLGLREGMVPASPVYDLCYKNSDLCDPLINDCHAVALGLVDEDELKTIYAMTAKINDVLKPLFLNVGICLVDFKIEFGRLPSGGIVLADEITPDNARFWDAATGEKYDKDRFRRDLGKVGDAYRTIYNKVSEIEESL